MTFIFSISPDQAGLRLDQAISLHLPEISRNQVASLVSRGEIKVDGAARRPSYRVKAGDTVSGDLDQAPPPRVEPQAMDLAILYEDRYILAINKPAGLVVHPGPGHPSGTLVNGLLAHDPAFGQPHWDPLRPGIVHRLDQDTSGLILLAKTQNSLGFLQKEFKQRRVEKHYLALVLGETIPDSGEIEAPIGRHPKDRKRMAVVPEKGKYARTGFRVKERFDGAALVDVRLYTGRTHQIRVHFYHAGMPILGDPVYQVRRQRKTRSLAPRQMLHSWTLSFCHPFSGQRMEICAPLPLDFTAAMENLARI